MEKRVKYGQAVLLLLITGLLLYGYFSYVSNDPPPLKASIPVNAGDLINLSDKDEALFNQEYLYKVLSVRGVIRKIKKNKAGITVMLGGQPALPEVVSCSLDPLYTPHSDLQTGDSCTIQGKCAGLLKDVILLQCIIEK